MKKTSSIHSSIGLVRAGELGATELGSESRGTSRAFTLIELLIVIAIIAILMVLVFVSAGAIRRNAASAATTGLLNTLTQAIAAFEKDFAYEPPLVTNLRTSSGNATQPASGGIETPEFLAQRSGNSNDAVTAYRSARYSSQFSLPVYLLGMGCFNGRATSDTGTSETTGFPPNTAAVGVDKPDFKLQAGHDGVPGPGLRNPGPLRTWKKAGNVPNTFSHAPDLTGRVYGPYLDPAQLSRNLEMVEVVPSSDPARALRPAIDDFDTDTDIYMYRFVEASGEPIRYYRGWPVKDPDATNAEQPSIARVPVELRDADAIRTELTLSNTNGAALPSDSRLMSASYMLLAPNVDTSQKFIGQPSAEKPFEFTSEELFEKAMPFGGGVTDPKFNAARLNDEQGYVGRALLEDRKSVV